MVTAREPLNLNRSERKRSADEPAKLPSTGPGGSPDGPPAGLGHLYLREWLRAVAWCGLWLGTLAGVVRTAGVSLGTVELLAAIAGLIAAVDGLPFQAVVGLFAVTAFATLDAYWVAARNNRRLVAAADRCPHCGEVLDPTLEFCHWCTTRLRDDDAVDAEP